MTGCFASFRSRRSRGSVRIAVVLNDVCKNLLAEWNRVTPPCAETHPWLQAEPSILSSLRICRGRDQF